MSASAVALDFGLITPIIFKAQTARAWSEISDEVKDPGRPAPRPEKLKPNQYEGGGFSDLEPMGMYGVTSRICTSIINPPQSCDHRGRPPGEERPRSCVNGARSPIATVMTCHACRPITAWSTGRSGRSGSPSSNGWSRIR